MLASRPVLKQLPPHRLESLASWDDKFQPRDAPTAKPRGEEDAQAGAALTSLYGLKPEPPPPDSLPPVSNQLRTRPIGSTDVFMDDFTPVGQGSPHRLTTLRRHLLHSVDAVLSRPQPGDGRNEAVSLKKLLTGDGSWCTRKLILGWIVDSVRQTIELPPHQKQMLHDIFASLQGLRRVSSKHWRSILGKLQFVSLAIPGSAGLFSALQWAQNQAGTRAGQPLRLWPPGSQPLHPSHQHF
jgi:hypothetical protein